MLELSIKYNKEKNILIIPVIGDYKRRDEDVSEIQRVIIEACSKYGCRKVVIDFTQAKLTGSVMSIFKTGNPPEKVSNELRKIRFAHVYLKISEDEQFFENVAVNRGFNIRVFDEFKKAIEWLEQ
jgi:hypothetical protein